MNILVLLTGGTIDSYYDSITDSIRPYEESVLPDYFNFLKTYLGVRFSKICMKDSRELEKADLDKIISEIEKAEEKFILITHGTYTMPDSARYLEEKLKDNEKVIVLTGAMKPLRGFDASDAPFNLGFALGKMTSLEPGVYLAMNGRVFEPKEVSKTLSEGRFTSLKD